MEKNRKDENLETNKNSNLENMNLEDMNIEYTSNNKEEKDQQKNIETDKKTKKTMKENKENKDIIKDNENTNIENNVEVSKEKAVDSVDSKKETSKETKKESKEKSSKDAKKEDGKFSWDETVPGVTYIPDFNSFKDFEEFQKYIWSNQDAQKQVNDIVSKSFEVNSESLDEVLDNVMDFAKQMGINANVDKGILKDEVLDVIKNVEKNKIDIDSAVDNANIWGKKRNPNVSKATQDRYPDGFEIPFNEEDDFETRSAKMMEKIKKDVRNSDYKTDYIYQGPLDDIKMSDLEKTIKELKKEKKQHDKGISDSLVIDVNAESSLDDLKAKRKEIEGIIGPKKEDIKGGKVGFELIKNIFPKRNSEEDPDVSVEENEFPGPDFFGMPTPEPVGIEALKKYATCLNDNVKEGKIEKIIGRDFEIQRVLEILNRKNKNNPCLIGEPGVGKTAIAQGLAEKIVNGEVPDKLLDKKLYLLDMGRLIAGTQFRGQYEQRLDNIISYCKKDKNIIIVIDEIHTIVGNQEQESTSAANILKPALASGQIQIIGTTTLEEYRKNIEKDSALERRFQTVIIDEPTPEMTVEILKGIKANYEQYHRVIISDSMIEKLVKVTDKYIHQRNFPDKAIDVLDEACSRLNLNNIALHEYEKAEKEIKELEKKVEDIFKLKIRVRADIPEDLMQKVEEYNSIIRKKAYEINMQIVEKEEHAKKLYDNIPEVYLQFEDIAKVIEKQTKIPVGKITKDENQKLLELDKVLKKEVIGQDMAVELVAKAIRRKRAGLQTTKRPPSFIFVGQTGVGKTLVAKKLAQEMFGSEKQLIRLDMSEYMEKYSVSKLIGTAPGYVGYQEAGQLTEKVRRNPYSLILFDEIEKAHPEIFNLLLQVLDDGRLTDSHGRVVNFENTIIIMTSNIGSSVREKTIGFGQTTSQEKQRMLKAVNDHFRPEFLNRIDEIVVFNRLTEQDIKKIIDLLLENTRKALENMNITMHITDAAKEYIAKVGTNLEYGARPLRRTIQREIEDSLTELLLEGKLRDGDIVNITKEEDHEKLDFDVVKKVKEKYVLETVK